MREARVEALFATLFDAQFWLMGRDVEHPEGNLLQRLGFARRAAPDPGAPSRYEHAEGDRAAIVWRCGLFLHTPDARCLCVRGSAPRTVEAEGLGDCWSLAAVFEVFERGTPCSTEEFGQACRWLADYERSVRDCAGTGHRVPDPGNVPALAAHRRRSLERSWLSLADLGGSAAGGRVRPSLSRG